MLLKCEVTYGKDAAVQEFCSTFLKKQRGIRFVWYMWRFYPKAAKHSWKKNEKLQSRANHAGRALKRKIKEFLAAQG